MSVTDTLDAIAREMADYANALAGAPRSPVDDRIDAWSGRITALSNQGEWAKSHEGACGPDTSCDSECAAAYYTTDLWCLHILGPDNVHPAPSKEHAQKAADLFNSTFNGHPDVPITAVAAIWPHSAKAHAEEVGAFIAEWLIPARDLHPAEADRRDADHAD